MLHHRLKFGFQAILALGFVLELYERQWLNAAIVLGILVAVSMLPVALARGLDITIPPELELLTIAFIFGSIFLGETHEYYFRFWWWDILLHATSGGLLGVFGFMLVFVLNENPRVDVHMRAGFVALFAFCFALATGALWEIFEFTMDRVFGTTMQKPMFDDPSGLTDTMWDLIVDAGGALIVVAIGHRSMRLGPHSFLARRLQRFVEANPRLFPRSSDVP